MSNIRRYTKIRKWTVSELIDATSLHPRGDKRVTIPEFQRRLVWSNAKQKSLIDSVKRGYPFGSLLMFRDIHADLNLRQYKLIDGLQRTQALRAYAQQPNRAFHKADIPEALIDAIALELNLHTGKEFLSSKVRGRISDAILKWVWDGSGFTEAQGWSVSALCHRIIERVFLLNRETYEFYRATKSLLDANSPARREMESLMEDIAANSDIGQAEVPVIVFEGPSSELPIVFKLLNTQGAKLTRYEVFAAQWLDHRKPIVNPSIIKAIWDKYAALASHGFALDVITAAPDEQARQERNYTLFEYLFGFGQLLTKLYPRLFKPVKVDQPHPAGFNLVAACLGLGVQERDFEGLPDKIRALDQRTLETRILEAVDFVDKLFEPILLPQRQGASRIPYFHADLQIVAIIATVFQRLVDPLDLVPRDRWQEDRETLSQNLPMYYLFEILRGDWRGSGDARLSDTVQIRSYMNQPPSAAHWSSALDLWFANHVSRRLHSRRHIKDDYSEFLLLRYIFAQRLPPSEEPTFVVEHIVPIENLLSPPSVYAEISGPINTVGNLAILPEPTPWSTYFEVADTYNQHIDSGDASAVEFRAEMKRCLGDMLCEESMLPAELTEEGFEGFLRRRFRLLKDEFVRVWREHIPDGES